ncbi:unnamed protein product [marine sediment metagenome]|uniref:Uncharacterized protein n=1 Tax=marine sediment metagenome TaxID=412755 RepID=X1J8D2_9ZZZZ
MYTQVTEFKHVVKAVIEEEVSSNDCVELILGQGINSMLADLLGPLDQIILLKSFQQLGSQYPTQVYRYVAETLKTGAAAQEKMKQKLGFLRTVKEDIEMQ